MSETFSRIVDSGVIAVLRAKSSAELMDVAKALRDGGVIAIEVTMTTPGALKVIEAVANEMSDQVIIGAGTVLDPETARTAILSGAEYIVAPTTSEETIRLVRRYAKVMIPGAFTPTEVLHAWECGADAVKVFPCTTVGPAYIKDLKGPLPQIPLVPTGGVSVETTAAFIKAGACAVAAGTQLVSKEAVEKKDWKAITDTAARMIEEVRKGRA